MKKQFVAYGVTAAVVSGAVAVLAQAPPAPKPGLEHKALAYYVGKWTGESELKPGPFGPGGKMTSADTCESFGGFHVVCRGEGKGVMGEMKTLGVLSYSAGDKTYKFYAVDTLGVAELSGKVLTNRRQALHRRRVQRGREVVAVGGERGAEGHARSGRP